ncbi:MAG TPA: YceI family protein [Noviherbaspirillum sp.]|jgi:polyisoprenoid-binding protein YceI|uniref:YceI family protein n=1 Tax=Noviherbaspirillum sp. TaxID=1926288 RepID=UPI002F92881C
MKHTIVSLLAAPVLLASAAHATEYTQVQPDKSAIAFAYQQMGVKMDGKFRKFNAQLRFDPAKAAAAKASFEVDLLSVDLDSGEAEQEVADKAWFNSKAFPTARFVSTAVKPLGGNRYEVAGQLSIKGKARDIVVPATFAEQGKTAVFSGSFALRRADYAIGEGTWSKFDVVANDVVVNFRITAAAN